MPHPSTPNNEKELWAEWEETVKEYNKSLQFIKIAEEVYHNLGSKNYDKIYPDKFELREIIMKLGYERDIANEFMNEIGYHDGGEYSPYIEDPQYQLAYFFGESCYGYGGHHVENNIFRFPYYMAFGGPNIWIQHTIEINYNIERREQKIYKGNWFPKIKPDEKITSNHKYKSWIHRIKDIFSVTNIQIKITKIEYGYSWWGQGGIIEITDDETAQAITEEYFEYHIFHKIETGINRGQITLPGKEFPFYDRGYK